MIRHKGVHIVLGYRFFERSSQNTSNKQMYNYVYLHVFYCTNEPQI